MQTSTSLDTIASLKLFHPYAFSQYERIKATGSYLVHYTAADRAVAILKSNCLWMRNVTMMNDFMEVQYGLECLAKAYNGDIGERFKRCLESIAPGLCKEMEDLFNGWSPQFARLTYVSCFSEHSSEDVVGRLSMWRAYGKSTGVAIVLNTDPFLGPSDALKAYTSPVAYLTQEGFLDAFAELTANLEGAREVLGGISREELHGRIFNVFRMAAMCTKHPGFAEEKEWRVIYTQGLFGPTHLEKNVEIIDGIPQTVYKIPLRDIPEEELVGIEIPKILRRIIIGPSAHELIVKDALAHLLAEAGVENATEKVCISGIPLR